MVLINTPVTFTDNSTNNPTSYEWDLGDGTLKIGKTVIHTYTTPGTYTVQHKANNACGAGNVCTQQVVVTSQPTHLECVNGICTRVDGAGSDTCTGEETSCQSTTSSSVAPLIVTAGLGLLMWMKK